jgi:hypothetical protein
MHSIAHEGSAAENQILHETISCFKGKVNMPKEGELFLILQMAARL